MRRGQDAKPSSSSRLDERQGGTAPTPGVVSTQETALNTPLLCLGRRQRKWWSGCSPRAPCLKDAFVIDGRLARPSRIDCVRTLLACGEMCVTRTKRWQHDAPPCNQRQSRVRIPSGRCPTPAHTRTCDPPRIFD